MRTVNLKTLTADKFSMKKSILLSLVVLSTTAFAQTPKDVVHQLDGIQNQMAAGPVCDTCEASKNISYTPQKALEDIKAGKLVFMGRDLFPGSDQNRTCVYKSDTAYILYNNCMASKKEGAATDIEVISFDGGIMHFYIENGKIEGPISEMTRSQYDSTWTVDYVPSLPPGNLDVNGLKRYMSSYDMINNKQGACFIGGSFKAQDYTVKPNCFGAVKNTPKAADWSEKAEAFWKDPGQGWYDSLKLLRRTIVGTKF